MNLSGTHLQTVFAAHTLTNTGNGLDTFDFASAISGDHTPTVSYYNDADGSGTLTPGDTVLTDTDGDTIPDTGLIASGAVFNLLIGYTIGFIDPQTPSGVATIVTTAASSFNVLLTASVTDTVTVLIEPDLLVLKAAVTVWDPINLGVNPKAIPGAVVDADSVTILDPIPVEGDLFVNDLGAPGSGPVQFSDGVPVSGLTYGFISLASGADDLFFSNDGGASFSYTPLPDADGYDANVTHIRIDPGGPLAAATAGGAPSFSLTFRIRIQ